MKTASKRSSNGMSPEYDFASMKGGVRGKYVKRPSRKPKRVSDR